MRCPLLGRKAQRRAGNGGFARDTIENRMPGERICATDMMRQNRPDLSPHASRAAVKPAIDDRRTRDAGAQEDAEHVLAIACGAKLVLGVQCELHVVSHPHVQIEFRLEQPRQVQFLET